VHLQAALHADEQPGTMVAGGMAGVAAATEAACGRREEMGVERIFCTMHSSTRTDKNQNMADKLSALAEPAK